MYYNVFGEGYPPLILIHGWTANHTRWHILEKKLAANFKVVHYDLRGHGLTQKGPSLEYGFSAHLLDLRGLMDSLQLPRAVIVGHSMGGMIAQQFSLVFPERVIKLILIGTSACVAVNEKEKAKLHRVAFLFRRLFRTTLFLKDHDKKKQPELYIDQSNPSLRVSSVSASSNLLSIAGMDLRPRLKNLKTPTLVIASEDDKTVPFEQSKELAGLIPDCEFRQTSGSGHHIMLEQPDFTARAIEEFIWEQD